MDFGTLLQIAKQNRESGKNEKYYSTKFAPPKKESKEKKLSDNIKKFLLKREQEDQKRQEEERKKLANLLAMRDEKSKNKIRKMLKVTKSANKSVLDEAINSEHTAVTMQGPDQPDQDDYGYVSNEANAFYQKYIEKVKDVKEDKGFAPSRPQSLKDLSGTKERVRAAICKDVEDKKGQRQRISHCTTSTINGSSNDSSSTGSKQLVRAYSTSKSLYDPEAERLEEDRKKQAEKQKKNLNRKPPPPPLDFQSLLKLAEKKQFEPVEALQEIKKKKEPERLLTSKEKRELEERQRAKEKQQTGSVDRSRSIVSNGRMDDNNRISKSNESLKTKTGLNSNSKIDSNVKTNKNPLPTTQLPKIQQKADGKQTQIATTTLAKPAHQTINSNGKPGSSSFSGKSSSGSKSSTANSLKASSSNDTVRTKSRTGTIPSNSSKSDSNRSDIRPIKAGVSKPQQNTEKTRQFPPSDSNRSNIGSSKASASKLPQKTRQFPPSDVQRSRPSLSHSNNSKLYASKRRIIDDDDDDEYDSDLDDFIDDGDADEDYSSHIKAIFGYDKSKYRDWDDDDDAAMESNFAQVQREEYISKKIGIKEDLEDMKMEALEKKRKMDRKKARHS